MVSLKTESYVLRRNLQGRKSTYGTRYQNQTVRQTDRQTDRYTDRQTDRFSIKQTNKQTTDDASSRSIANIPLLN